MTYSLRMSCATYCAIQANLLRTVIKLLNRLCGSFFITGAMNGKYHLMVNTALQASMEIKLLYSIITGSDKDIITL